MARVCPITRNEFHEHAENLPVTIGSSGYELEPRENESDSLGWKLNAKQQVKINGKMCWVQIGINITLIGSAVLD